jgi:hypothetical protein
LPPALIEYGWLWLLCSFQGPPERALPPAGHPGGRLRGTPCDDRRAVGLSKLNSMQPLTMQRRAYTRSRRTGCPPGRARSGRHARPRGRWPTLPPRPSEELALLGCGFTTAPCRAGTGLVLPRKEVIQPHLPVRLPCYDFTPVTSPTFDGSLPCGLGHRLRVLLTPVV